MNVKTNFLKATFAILAISTVIFTALPSAAFTLDMKVISGSPGDTISFSGTGTPDSKVRLEMSTGVSISTYMSGNKYHYKSDTMKNVNISGGNRMSFAVSPVDTLTVSSSTMGIDKSADGFVSNHTGTFSMDVPDGTYDIAVSGIANGSRSSMPMTIRVSRLQDVGRDGTYTVSINTSGLPCSRYTITQDGDIVAMVYLGIQAPATPTPTPSPCLVPGLNSTNATQVSNDDTGAWALYLVLIVFGSIVGVAAAYLFVVKKH